MTDCPQAIPGLALLSLGLLVSISLNLILYLRRYSSPSRGRATCCRPQLSDEESLSQDPGHYFPNPSHGQQHQEQANPDSCHEQIENPIYGNIRANRRASVEACYEMMTTQPVRDQAKFADPELNYASLDLMLAKQRKKKACRQGQHQPTVRHTTAANTFLEVNSHVDAELPSKDNSTMVSHSSIYLNSQQIAQETEDMERKRNCEGETSWDGVGFCWDGYSEREGRRDRQSYSNGSECTQVSEVEAGQSDGSLSESNQQN